MRAWFESTCAICKGKIRDGHRIVAWFGNWVHRECRENRYEAARAKEAAGG